MTSLDGDIPSRNLLQDPCPSGVVYYWQIERVEDMSASSTEVSNANDNSLSLRICMNGIKVKFPNAVNVRTQIVHRWLVRPLRESKQTMKPPSDTDRDLILLVSKNYRKYF